MRKLIVCNISSLDGYYEGPGKDVMALPMDLEFDDCFLELMSAADTMLLGATSYRGFMGFWPPQADNPDATAAQKQVGQIWKDIDKVVVSDSLAADDIAPWGETTVIPRAEAAERIAELKAQPGRDIVIFGSRTMWSPLLETGLIDELHLLVGGGVLAGGTRLFDAPLSGMTLLDHRRVGANALLVRYSLTDES